MASLLDNSSLDSESNEFATVNDSSGNMDPEPCDSNKDLFDTQSRGNNDVDNVEVIPASSSESGESTPTYTTGAMDNLNFANANEGNEKPDHDKMARFSSFNANATSTPLLSNMRRARPLANCDVTAIFEEDSDDNLIIPEEDSGNSDSPIPRKNRAKGTVLLSSEDEQEEEIDVADLDKEHETENHKSTPQRSGSAHAVANNKKDEFLDLSEQIENLGFGEEKASKSFKFKAPAGPTQIQKKPVIASPPIEIVTLDEDEGSSFTLSLEDDSPQFVEEIPPPVDIQRKGIAPEKPKSKQKSKFSIHDIHSRKPEAVKSSAVPPDILAYRSSVQKIIEHLADTLQNIPPVEARARPPSGLKVELYDHQSYGLEWLYWRENQFPGGGILADEMGLGKTIMMISLILRGKVEPVSDKPWIRSDAGRSKLVPSKSTLVIVPPSVLDQWQGEISSKSSKLRVNVYHGAKRTSSPAVLAQYDIVLSSYQTVSSEISHDGWRDRASPLERVYWQRIILDEGHVIRNSSTNSAKAVYKLEAVHRWVVTGTPVHNRPADMQSLIKFLRLKPFDDPAVWDYWIGLKTVKPGNMLRLNTIGKALILRRTKEEVKNVGGKVRSIPPKQVTDVKITMGKEHRQVYEYLKNFAESQFKLYLEGRETAAKQEAADNYIAGSGRKKVKDSSPEQVAFSTILVLMLRMRQVSVLPYLTSTMLPRGDDDDLSDEYDPLDEADFISHKNPAFAETFVSAKLEQLFEDLQEIKRKCLAEDRPMDKVIVVSQWTTLLSIVKTHLSERQYSVATISGEIKFDERAEIVKRFNSESKRPQIMLLSLAAGGVGLNLVGGNHMIFLDVHYNPQLELQAQDRIHRFGQTKDVYIRRYICEDSMEERVVDLQQNKLALSDGLLSSTSKKGAAGVGLTLQDIRKLFEM